MFVVQVPWAELELKSPPEAGITNVKGVRQQHKTMNESAQKHFDTIINALLPFALQMLGKVGTFLPFGGFIDKDGTFEQLVVEHGEQTEPKELVTLFRKVLEGGVRKDGYRAFGICAHMHAEMPGQTRKKETSSLPRWRTNPE